MISKKRLSSGKRRETIIDAAKVVFAENGFHGTTTRELADAAAVSEALLFKHFPNKKAIYAEMLSSCQKSELGVEARRVLALEPSTSTLAVMLHFLVSRLVMGHAEVCVIHRLMLRSLCEDAEFTRVVLNHVGSTWIPKLRDCLDAARMAGDVQPGATNLKSGAWLAQHVILMLAFIHVPAPAAVNYKQSQEKLAEDAVVFCMRGLGISDEAIKRFYNPRAFALLSTA